jgi:antitoxin MazE
MKVERWGDGLAMPIPEDVVAEFNIQPGDNVEFSVHDGKITMIVRPEKDAVRLMIERMRENRRPLPPDYKFNRAEANGFEEE